MILAFTFHPIDTETYSTIYPSFIYVLDSLCVNMILNSFFRDKLWVYGSEYIWVDRYSIRMLQLRVNFMDNFTNLYLLLSILELHEAMETMYAAINNIAIDNDQRTD
jgi:hypothetical protein